jgi:oligopeptide transport system substrate-binding protein
MRLILVALAAVVVVTGCSATEEPTPAPKPVPVPMPPPQPGVLTVGLPRLGNWLRDRMINHALYTPLVDYDPATGRVTPVGAESVTTADQITWIVKLRPSSYHDGMPVTANSYVDAWVDIKGDHPVPYKEIVPVDELTVRYVAAAPASYFPAFLASPWAAPMRHDPLTGDPIGNGPFRLAAPWQDGKGSRLVRVRPDGGTVRKIDIRVVADPSAAVDQVRAGTLDLVIGAPSGARQEFASRYVTWPKPEAEYLAFGSDTSIAARQAIALSVDRKTLTEGLVDDQLTPATRLFPPAIAPGGTASPCHACDFDPVEAMSLRAKSGLTALKIRNDGPQWDALADQLRYVLGLRTDLGPEQQIQSMNWNIDSPHEWLEFLGGSSVRQFVDAAAASGDPRVQAENYRLAEDAALRDLSIVPLWTGQGSAVWGERVHRVTATAARGVDLAAITL